MITAADAEFHPNGEQPSWAETLGFWWAAPEHALYGNVYVQARPNVGATIAAVNVVHGHHRLPYTVDFTDAHVHAPCPASMLHFELVNGLRVDVDDAPTGYRFGYRSINGAVGFDLALSAVMPAWDPHDPDDNPLVRDSADLGLGDAWAGGHLDFVGRTVGTVDLRGRRYEVDAMAGMDRSWGVRTEFGESAIAYLHVPFGADLAIHAVLRAEIDDDGELTYGALRFGYVLDGGAVFGLRSAVMTGVHHDLVPESAALTVTDERGKSWTLHGAAVASAPWYTFSPSYGTFQALMRWTLDGDGSRSAHGLLSEVLGVEYLAAATARARRAGHDHG